MIPREIIYIYLIHIAQVVICVSGEKRDVHASGGLQSVFSSAFNLIESATRNNGGIIVFGAGRYFHDADL